MTSSEARKPGLSVFFPAYNDSGTIASLVIAALRAARTADARLRGDRRQRRQRRRDRARSSTSSRGPTRKSRSCITRSNRGYGGALRSGFAAATRELVFYTDGDAQYDPAEMAVLWQAFGDDVDLVNGYKISRSDPLHRIVIGRIYHHTVKVAVRPAASATSTATSG